MDIFFGECMVLFILEVANGLSQFKMGADSLNPHVTPSFIKRARYS